VVAVSQGKTVSIGSAVQAISDVQFLAQAGQTYYLFITGSGNGNYSPATPGSGSGGMTGNYTVTTSLQPVNGSGQTNGSGGPTPVAISQGGAVVGNIGTDGSLVVGPSDIDLYQFTAPATETVAVHTGTSAEGSADTYLRIFDAQGNEIAHNAHFGGISTDSLLVLRVVAGQTYLIGVNGYSANAGAYNPLTGAGAAPGSTGNYLLTVTGPPTSAVQALPAFSAADFALNWSGTPAAGGPAIDHFDVYVSDNGGPYKLLLTHTLQTATTFHGVTGHTYSFYSIATDQFGNSQASPLTPQAATRVDTTPPVSSVAALPTFSPADFRVDWSGTDDPGGSGVASYDVYVSDNGGPFQALLTGTAQTSVSFHGVAGHIYAFYSVATDRMGNRQATPASAQAVTRIDATPPVSSVQPLRPANSPTFLLSWSGSDDTGGSGVASYTVFVSDNGAPYQPFISGTTQTSAVFHGSAGHSYAFYSIATDWAGNVQATPAAAQATTLAVGGIYATGADAGGGPEVKVYDAATGNLKFDFFAFSPQFTGGVRVAVGDVNGDGYPDVIAAAGPGGGPDVRVFDGQTGALIRQFFAFDSNFTGGVYVAAGDVNGDRDADIICGADAGGGPSVTVFSGNDGSILSSFFAFAPQFTGGVRVAAGDISADGHADIIAAAGPGGGPQVNVFSGADGSLLRSFFAYAPGFTGGVYVAAADVNGDGRADIITGAGPGGGPQINVFSGADNSLLQTYLAYASDFTGGVRVAAVDANGGGFADVVTVAGPGGGPQVRSINPLSLQLVDDFFALDPRFSGGLYVAGG
jgi:hypothetical protein